MASGEEIGSIFAKLSADTSDFLAKMAEAEIAAKATADSMSNTGNSASHDLARGLRDGESASRDFTSGLKDIDTWLGNLGGGGGIIGTVAGGFGNLGQGIMRLTQFVGDGVQAFGNLIAGMSDGIPIVGDFGVAIGGAVASLGEVMPVLGPVLIALVALPAIAGIASFAVSFLAGEILTLTAIVAAFIPPLTLMGVLMGGLGVGFVLAGIHAIGAKAQFAGLASTVSQIKSGFSDLISTLASRLAPAFQMIGNDALHLVDFLNRIVKLPLVNAMQQFSTQGVKIVGKMADDIGHLMSKPFTLIVHDAFASSSQVHDTFVNKFSELRDYLFGHVESIFVAPIHQTMTQNVPGALQPILTWFNSQHFTKTGIRWLNELTAALEKSGAWASLWGQVKQMADTAGGIAGHAFAAAFEAELTSIPGAILNAIGVNSSPNPAGSGGIYAHPPSGIGHHPAGALGAVVTRPTLALIGEAGAEAVVPLNRTPGAHALGALHGGSSGGGNVTVHVHGFVGSPTELVRKIRDAMVADARTGSFRAGYFGGFA